MSEKQTILVTGSNGQLGRELRDLEAAYPQYRFLFFGREEFPIDDAPRAQKIFLEHHPRFLVNCAAYTAVDLAEKEREAAIEINGRAPARLALWCRESGAKFIHISTDYVFNGLSKRPLKEDDQVDPVNFYGETKLLGEQLAMQANPESIIIRTSWVYSFYGKNFVKTMIRLMKERDSIGVVNDQKGSPTYAADLAAAIMTIIGSAKWEPGTYNYSNEGEISWFDFALEIKKLINANCEVKPIATADFPTPAKRPAYSVLDHSRIRQTYSVSLKGWRESLQTCIARLMAISEQN